MTTVERGKLALSNSEAGKKKTSSQAGSKSRTIDKSASRKKDGLARPKGGKAASSAARASGVSAKARRRTRANDSLATISERAASSPASASCAVEGKRGVMNKELGARGEEAAVSYLKRRGYEIVARNWTCIAGEADIVALCDEAIVFVEVKTRSGTDMGMPEEAVDERKRSRYEKIAALFLADYDIVDVQVRFDIISLLVIAPERALVRHHINAFGVA